MNEILNLAAHGVAAFNPVAASDIALAVVRSTIGGFFFISGFNKLFNPARHGHLVQTLTKDKVPAVPFMQWWVPGWELLGGAMLAVGLFSAFAATVLLIICIVALCCEGADRVAKYGPINFGDRIADYLYLQETLYAILLVTVMLAGTGAYSLDHLLFPVR